MWIKIIFSIFVLCDISSFGLSIPIESDIPVHADSFTSNLQFRTSTENVPSLASSSSSPSSSSSSSSSSPPSPLPSRRVVTYDQRQEGKYNIRADLENFVLLVVPSNPSSSTALLDMLIRPNLKNLQRKNPSKKVHKFKKGSISEKSTNPLITSHSSDDTDPDDEQPNRLNDERFIEGRTPYHVDISGLGPDVIETRSISIPQHQFPVSRNIQPLVFPFRNSKAIIDSNLNDLRSNSIVAILTKSNDLGSELQRSMNDVDRTDPENSFDSMNSDGIDQLAASSAQRNGNSENDGWELTLLGAQEQCGPDRKRDSYGICQFVPQDF